MSDWLDIIKTTRFYDDEDKIWIVQNEFRAVPDSIEEQWLRLTHIWYYNIDNQLLAEEYEIDFDKDLEVLRNLHIRNNDDTPIYEKYLDGHWYLVLGEDEKFAQEIKKPRGF